MEKRIIQELGSKSGILYDENKAQYVTMTMARDQKFRKTNHFLVILEQPVETTSISCASVVLGVLVSLNRNGFRLLLIERDTTFPSL